MSGLGFRAGLGRAWTRFRFCFRCVLIVVLVHGCDTQAMDFSIPAVHRPRFNVAVNDAMREMLGFIAAPCGRVLH